MLLKLAVRVVPGGYHVVRADRLSVDSVLYRCRADAQFVADAANYARCCPPVRAPATLWLREVNPGPGQFVVIGVE